MKYLLTLIIITTFLGSIIAQDLIITNQNDSIKGQVVSYSNGTVEINRLDAEGKFYKSNINANDIQLIRYDFYKADKKTTAYASSKSVKQGPTGRVYLDLGYNVRLTPLETGFSSDEKSKHDQIMKGAIFGLGMEAIINRKYGVGLKLAYKSNSISEDRFLEFNDGSSHTFDQITHFGITYIGLTARYYSPLTEQFSAFGGANIGMLMYSERYLLDNEEVISYRGSTTGYGLDIGLAYKPSGTFELAIYYSLLFGHLGTAKSNNVFHGLEDKRIDISSSDNAQLTNYTIGLLAIFHF